MKRSLVHFILLFVILVTASGKQFFEAKENFNTPRFYPEKIFLWEANGTTRFVNSLNTGFTWGAFSPAVTTNWCPIGYLYHDDLGSIRNAMCFTNDSESQGSYAYCRFNSESTPGVNDSLVGLASVSIDYMCQNAQDKLGLMVRDANGQWFYSDPKHALPAAGTTVFFVDGFTWWKVAAAVSQNLDTHQNIENGLGDVRQGAVEGTPDLSYITGGGVIFQHAVIQDKNLRIKSIEWKGKQPGGLPKLIAPANGAQVSSLSTTLKWNYETDEIAAFNVYLAKAGEEMKKIASEIAAHQYKVENLSDNTNYNWRVDVVKTGETLTGVTWNFSVKKGMSQFFKDLKTQKIASSDAVTWTQFGPGNSGYCEEFWCHPTDENVMFQSPDMYNSYGTWDGGQSWQTIKDCDGTGVDMRRVQAITFSHQNPGFGMAVDVRGYLYKTTNQGRSWTKIKEMGGKHSELAVDPTNDQVWYMGAGDFWNVKFNHRTQAALNDRTKGYFYKYAAYGHVYKTIDAGKTWKKITSGLPAKLDVGKIIVDPTNPNVVIMAGNYGIYRSTNKGESWVKAGIGLPNNMPRDMHSYYNAETGRFLLFAVDQTRFIDNGTTVTSSGGVYKSSDCGLTWTNITGNLALDLSNNGITNWVTRDKFHNAVGFWFGQSKTWAKSRYPQYPGSILAVYNRLRVNPNDSNEIYIAANTKHDKTFGTGDVWKTEDGGKNWFPTARAGNYWRTTKDAAYWKSRGVTKSMNTTFAHLQHEMEIREEYWGNRILEINKNGDVFIALDQQTLRSTNNGKSWHQVDDHETEPGSKHWVGSGDSNLPGRFLLLETGMKNRYLLCSGEHGLWQTASLGSYADTMAVAVEQIEGQVHEDGAHSIATVAVHPTNPDIIYTLQFRQSHRGKFRRTTNGGKSWENIGYPCQYGGNLSSDNIFQYSLTIDYHNPANIYFCVMDNPVTEVSSKLLPDDYTDRGVLRSTDGGKNWELANNGIPEGSSVHRLVIDPENPEIIYAALNDSKSGKNGGLYKTTDKAGSWTKMTIPSGIKSVNNFFIDRNTRYMYISCGRYEGTFDEGGVWRSKDEGASWEKIFYHSYVWQCETSPVNTEIITVNAAMPHESKGGSLYNPGAYLSTDDGENWVKINTNLGQPNTITDLKPDPYTEGVYWCALKGSGWAIGYAKDHERAWWQKLGTKVEDIPMKADGLIVYPNPVLDVCSIKLDKITTGKVVVQVYNVKGAKLLSKVFSGSDTLGFSAIALEKGMHVLSVETAGKRYLQKFMKE